MKKKEYLILLIYFIEQKTKKLSWQALLVIRTKSGNKKYGMRRVIGN
jgi:hypothetical protein